MARKKKELPLLEQVEITGVAAEGKALARVNDLVVFVPFAAPGDIVDLQLMRKKHNYAEARIVKFHAYPSLRVILFASISVFAAGVNGNMWLMTISYNLNGSKWKTILPA